MKRGLMVGMVVAHFGLMACEQAQEHTAAAVHERDSASMMVSSSTRLSLSGGT